MRNKLFIVLLLFIILGCQGCQKNNQASINQSAEIVAARAVFSRVLGDRANSVKLEMLQPLEGRDTYEYVCTNGKLIVKGSSVSALSRGMYDYLKNNHLGMLDWSGPQFRLPKQWPDVPLTKVTSPFRIRHAYNAVTSGYTTPYWNWDRWEKELDWQAMHGFNMMMAPVATEAIMLRVWKQLGLTQEEIDEFNTGPAHLPFDKKTWELTWVSGSGVSAIKPFDDPLKAAQELVSKALSEQIP